MSIELTKIFLAMYQTFVLIKEPPSALGQANHETNIKATSNDGELHSSDVCKARPVFH
jgi:hypothetical protein